MAKRLPPSLAPDLAVVNCTELDLLVEMPAEAAGSVATKLGIALPQALKADYVENYSRGRVPHQAYGWFVAGRGRKAAHTLHLVYDLAPAPFPGARGVRDLFQALGELDLRSEVRCEARFRYPDDAWSSIVALPWKLLQEGVLPFDEFRGFRAVKLQGDELLYTIIVDRPTNSAIAHFLSFSNVARLDSETPGALLEQATRISRRLVLPKQQDDNQMTEDP